MVLKARSLKSRGQPGWFFWRAGREGSAQASLLGLLMAVLTFSSHHPSSMSVCLQVQISPYYKDTNYIGLGTTLKTSL